MKYTKDTNKVQFNLFIPAHYRDTLRRMAAEQVLRDPRKSTTGAKLAVDILCEHLKKLEDEGGK